MRKSRWKNTRRIRSNGKTRALNAKFPESRSRRARTKKFTWRRARNNAPCFESESDAMEMLRDGESRRSLQIELSAEATATGERVPDTIQSFIQMRKYKVVSIIAFRVPHSFPVNFPRRKAHGTGTPRCAPMQLSHGGNFGKRPAKLATHVAVMPHRC